MNRQLKTGYDNEPCCVVGKHTEASVINDGIHAGTTYERLGEQYDIDPKYLSNHARDCLGVYRHPKGVSGCYGTDKDWGATPRKLIWEGEPYGDEAAERWDRIATEVAR